MTVWRCDKCHKTIELNEDYPRPSGWETIQKDDISNQWDLCIECVDLFYVWIKSGREQKIEVK